MAKIYQKNNYSSNYTRHLIRGNVTGNLGINSALRFKAIYGEGIDRIQVLRKLQKENQFRFWWYLIFGIATLACLIWQPSSWLSVIDVFVLMVNIDFVARGKVSGIYIGILECLLYIVICSLTGLWGEVIKMAAVNIPLNIVAVVSWTKNIKAQKNNKYEKQNIQIRRLDAKGWILSIVAIAVFGVAGYFFLKFLGTTSLIISSIAFAFGIVNKVLSGQRYMESYVINLINQVIAIVLWITVLIQSADISSIVLVIAKLACLADSIYGYFLWKDMYRQEKVNGGTILAKRKVNIKRVIKLRRTYKKLYWNKDIDIKH